MECFDVCLTILLSKITSVLNAKMFFIYTNGFKHVLRKKDVFLLFYLVLTDSHENLNLIFGLEGGGGGKMAPL